MPAVAGWVVSACLPLDQLPALEGVAALKLGVWRPTGRKFLLDSNGNNTWDGAAGGDIQTAAFGLSTDLPLAGRW